MDDVKYNLNINNLKLLNDLSSNLGVDHIANGSNLKKMVDAFYSESNSIVNYSNSILKNVALDTANEQHTELFGNQYGVTRKRYKTVSFKKESEVAFLKVSSKDYLLNNIEETKVFSKNEVVILDNLLSITFLEDVHIENINTEYPVSLKITNTVLEDTFLIPKNTIYDINNNSNIVLNFSLLFNKSVGLAHVTENLYDYKSRIQASATESQNAANSVLNIITKEVPFISLLESDAIEGQGLAQQAFIYTDNLVRDGYDVLINTLIIPLLETNLENRSMIGTTFEFKSATPLKLSVNIETNDSKLSNAYLSTILPTINNYLFTLKGDLLVSDIKQLLSNYLLEYSVFNIDVVLVSMFSSEIVALDSKLYVPLGRYLQLTNLERINIRQVENLSIEKAYNTFNNKYLQTNSEINNNINYIKLICNKSPVLDTKFVKLYLANNLVPLDNYSIKIISDVVFEIKLNGLIDSSQTSIFNIRYEKEGTKIISNIFVVNKLSSVGV